MAGLLPPTAAPAGVKLPDQPSLAILLRGLLDRDVTLHRGEPDDADGFTAIYVNRDGVPVCAARFDLALASSAGAALALIPAAQAEQWVAAGELDDEGLGNASEVLNVLASAVNNANDDLHVKLHEVLPLGQAAQGRAAQVTDAPLARVRYEVRVDGYPTGSMTLLAR